MIVPAASGMPEGCDRGPDRELSVAPGVVVTRRRALGAFAGALGLLAAGCRSVSSRPGEGLEELLQRIRPLARDLLRQPGGATAEAEEAYLRLVTDSLLRLQPEPEWRSEVGRAVAMAGRAYVPPVALFEIRLARGARLELHDHRDYDGVLAALDGSVAITSYHFANADGTHRSVLRDGVPTEASFLVRRTGARLLRRGGTASLARDRDNLHELVAGPSGCRLLDCFTYFEAGAGSHELVLDRDPVAGGEGLFRAAWKV
jgi:hypothetical protein